MQAAKKKLYMLFDLEPDESLTGGAWYADEEFDGLFVDTLRKLGTLSHGAGAVCVHSVVGHPLPRHQHCCCFYLRHSLLQCFAVGNGSGRGGERAHTPMTAERMLTPLRLQTSPAGE